MKKPNFFNSINSYLGIFKHYNSFKIRKELFSELPNIDKYGYFNDYYTKFIRYYKHKNKNGDTK